MFYKVKDVAEYIISTCYGRGKPVSNLKLQKLLYYAWIGYYRETGDCLFYDDFCAWQLGPVVPDVYYEYCTYGGRPICALYGSAISEDDSKILDDIIDEYLDCSASDLVYRTHRPGGAWDCVYRGGKGNREVISKLLIKQKDC